MGLNLHVQRRARFICNAGEFDHGEVRSDALPRGMRKGEISVRANDAGGAGYHATPAR
jgi:inosine/xanthosine triphosphate pyrophosphatase family protein